MRDIYNTLNSRQQEAVFHTEGPLLILAGAGSGKTRVLTHRIAYLIDEKGVNPWNILAITFTNKAASEMRERVDKIVGFGSESIWVSTFHSTCVRILRRHIDSTVKILTEGGAVGRKLDFIVQEMNREANTILSKANSLIISDKGIDLKTEIEKVREQIQNIE